MNASIERRETSSSPNTKTTSHTQNTIQHASQRKRSCRRRPPRPEQQLRPQRHQRAFEPREQERRCRCLLLCCKRIAIPLLSAVGIERGGLALGHRPRKGSGVGSTHLDMRWLHCAKSLETDDIASTGRCRFPFQQLERGSSSPVSHPFT